MSIHKNISIAIGIATFGRKEVLSGILSRIARQTHRADHIFVAASDPADVDLTILSHVGGTFVEAGNGLCIQRNAILDAAGDTEILVFFDDDFVPEDSYLETLLGIYDSHPDVVGITGNVWADGVVGRGLAFDRACEIVDLNQKAKKSSPSISDCHNLYGCNMSFRMSAVRHLDIRFDPRLVLYGWLEDADFTRQLLPCGRLVSASAPGGVHMGVKRGRTSGIRLGYSQVVNPFYLAQKGHVSKFYPWKWSLKNIMANLAKYFLDRDFIDRAGRIKGNFIGIKSLLKGETKPEKITEL